MACFPRLKLIARRTSSTPTRDGCCHPHPTEKDDSSSKKYGWKDIERLTRNFSRVVGSGGFSTVFFAHLPGSVPGAVKIHGDSDHLYRVFKQELDIHLQLRHDNIVKLLGYCDDQERGALVLEYVPNGSLQDKLHGSASEVVPWKRRMAIAFQLALALEYLHEKCALHIVHGDVKASNILLDENLNCKLCDLGFAKIGFSSTVKPCKQVMMGSPGCTDPHYLRTGIASKKNDVYSYGVIILELVTGMEAFCEERAQPLTSLMGPLLNGEAPEIAVADIVDPRLGGDFDITEARAMLSLSATCLAQSPVLRPSAAQILLQLGHNIPSLSFLLSSNKD